MEEFTSITDLVEMYIGCLILFLTHHLSLHSYSNRKQSAKWVLAGGHLEGVQRKEEACR